LLLCSKPEFEVDGVWQRKYLCRAFAGLEGSSVSSRQLLMDAPASEVGTAEEAETGERGRRAVDG